MSICIKNVFIKEWKIFQIYGYVISFSFYY